MQKPMTPIVAGAARVAGEGGPRGVDVVEGPARARGAGAVMVRARQSARSPRASRSGASTRYPIAARRSAWRRITSSSPNGLVDEDEPRPRTLALRHRAVRREVADASSSHPWRGPYARGQWPPLGRFFGAGRVGSSATGSTCSGTLIGRSRAQAMKPRPTTSRASPA